MKLTGEAILLALNNAREELHCYTVTRPAFRSRPIGAPCSTARANQDNEIALEDSAKQTMEKLDTLIKAVEDAFRNNASIKLDY